MAALNWEFGARPLTVACVLTIAACGISAPELRYIGSVTPTGPCGEASRGTLTAKGKSFAFTPSDGVILMRGDIAADGTAHAQLTTQGADKKPFMTTLSARISGDQIDGSYVTPRCAFTISLTRVHPGLF
jgi:hypothetical protein